MRTRRQTVAAHCPATRAPMEIWTAILADECLSHADHKSVAQTCRHLRVAAQPFMDRELHVVPNRKASFDCIVFLAKHQARGQLLRVLDIAMPETFGIHAKNYIPTLVAAFPIFISLASISIPLCLLNNELFRLVYGHPHITKLGLPGSSGPEMVTLDVDSRVRLHDRVVPLETRRDIRVIRSDANTAFLERLVAFLQFHSVRVPRLWFGIESLSSAPTFLTVQDLPSLDVLSLEAPPQAAVAAFTYIEDILVTQTSLQHIWLRLFADGGLPFNFLDGWCRSWQLGMPFPPPAAFKDAWQDVRVNQLEIDFYRDHLGSPLIPTRVRIIFERGTVVTPAMICHLCRGCDTGAVMLLGWALRWSDWSATVQALRDDAEILGILLFKCSFTPIATVSTTLACSPSCYAKLADSNPALYAASELVGGYLALWDVTYQLNVERLRLVGSVFEGHDMRELTWNEEGPGGLVVGVEAVAEEDGSWASWDDGLPGLPTEEKVRRCFCFGCGDVKDGEDPVSALMQCGVEEVRAALAVGGFDLAAFDAGPTTQPVDKDSFETFLRSHAV